MKKNLMLLTLLLLALAFTGCGNQESNSTGTQSSEISKNETSSSTEKEKNAEEDSDIPEGEKITISTGSEDLTGYYEGEKENDLPDGYGKFVSETSDGVTFTYEGDWKKGVMDGTGRITHSNGSTSIAKLVEGSIFPFNFTDIPDLFDTPEKYEEYYIELTGEICSPVTSENSSVKFYFTLAPNDPTKGILVDIPNSVETFEKGDTVSITGLVTESIDGSDIGVHKNIPAIKSLEVSIISKNADRTISNGENITINLESGQETGYYVGEMMSGLPDGYGKFTSKPLDTAGKNYYTYEGDWRNGIMHGLGKLTLGDGSYYISRFKGKDFTYIDITEISDLYSNPDDYERYCVDFTGEICSSVAATSDLYAFFITPDSNKLEESICVFASTDFGPIEQGDTLNISGMFVGTVSGKEIGVDHELPFIKPMRLKNLSKN